MKIKKILAVIVAALMLALTLTACGFDSSEITRSLWTGSNEEGYAAALGFDTEKKEASLTFVSSDVDISAAGKYNVTKDEISVRDDYTTKETHKFTYEMTDENTLVLTYENGAEVTLTRND